MSARARTIAAAGGTAPPGCACCTRRAVLLGAAASLVACGGAPAAQVPTDGGRARVSLARFPALRREGGVATIEGDDGPILVRRGAGETVTALSLRCTHEGCIVGWKPEVGELHCPCHGSRFAGGGEVLEGPARRPLPSYEAQLAGDEVHVRLGDGGAPRST